MSAYVDERGGKDGGKVTALRESPSIKRLGNSSFVFFPSLSLARCCFSSLFNQELVQCELFLSALKLFPEVHHSIIIENVHCTIC